MSRIGLLALLSSLVTILFLSSRLDPGLFAYQEQKPQQGLREEEETDYFKKWLKEDVVYIITPEEREVFQSLSTPEEKEKFIEQFWARRDPDIRTPINEFKEEHYRRIAYANEHFQSGFAGWKTDRGRIYIIHGPPDQVISRPTGGPYDRPLHEGGGSTVVYPYEEWWYRHIDGIGDDIQLEFVDDSFTGRYRLAVSPHEKDALLNVANLGPTMAEVMGAAEKRDRPYFSPGNRSYPLMTRRAKDNPFMRYETIAKVQRHKPIKYKDFKEIVDVDVSYNGLPFKLRKDYFELNDDSVLVPITLQIDNSHLTFTKQGEHHLAKVGVFAIVTSITNEIVTEFEDELISSYGPHNFEQARQQKSIYQKTLVLDKGMRYKLDFVVKDLLGEDVGVSRQAIIPPAFDEAQLTTSSLILSDSIRQIEEVPEGDQMFVLGDVLIYPRLDKTFSNGNLLGLYFHVYNVKLDQTNFSPALKTTVRILQDGKTILEATDHTGQSIQYFSAERVVLIARIPITNMPPEEYSIQVEIEDQIREESVILSDRFKVRAS